jgi:hypothetical protein
VHRADLRERGVRDRGLSGSGEHGDAEPILIGRERRQRCQRCGQRSAALGDQLSEARERGQQIGAPPWVVREAHPGAVIARPGYDGAQPAVLNARASDDGCPLAALHAELGR